jgi:lysozyme
LEDGKTYYWKVRAYDGLCWGDWSGEWSFMVHIPTGRINGIDISHWQGDIDWSTVYNSDYKFAFVKATEGVDYPDPNFKTNMNGGSNAGMLMGAYHFATPYTSGQNDAVAEAQYFVNVSSNYLEEGYLRPVLDLEQGADLGTETLSNWVHDWMNTVKTATGVEPILYVNSNYANNHLDSSVSQYDLWIAHWTYNPDTFPNTGIWAVWDFWQYSDNGSVPGISGDVDLDIFNGDMARLNTFIIHGSQPNYPPVASRNYPTTRDVHVNAGDGITFEVGATDSDGNLMEVVWLLDDVTQVTNSISGYSDTDSWSYTFNTAGNFMVEGFVRDTDYEIDYVDWIVHVNQAPTATIDSIIPDPAAQGTDTVSFAGYGTDFDGSVVAYNWRSNIDGQLSTSSSFTKSASDLSVGTHTIYFKVQDDDGAWSTEDTEDLTIEPASVPVLTYSPTSHNLGDKCEGETDSTTFEISNAGSGTLTYSLSEGCGWVDVSPTSGSSTGEYDTITVDIDTTGLSEGSHTCDISISSNGGSGTFTVTVNVISCEEPVLSYSPASHNFGDKCEGETDSTTFEIWNSGSGTLTYSLSESCGWVAVQSNGGSSTGEHDTITVDIDTTGLSKDSHTCDIAINSNDGSGTFTVGVTIINIPVLLVHGFGGSPIETWGTMKERLENDNVGNHERKA